MTNEKNYQARFTRALGGLALTLGEEVPEERFLAYFKIFKNHDPDAVLAAIDLAGLSCKFFPKPAELIELMTGGKGGGQDPTSAWQQVLKAMESIGSYSNAEFPDGAIAAAVMGLGGWPSLCELGYEELTLQRIPARFAALYSEAVRHGRHHSPGTVIGIIDRDNAARGYEFESPAIRAKTMPEIMDAAKAMRPAMKLIDAPKPVAEIPTELQKAASNLSEKVKF